MRIRSLNCGLRTATLFGAVLWIATAASARVLALSDAQWPPTESERQRVADVSASLVASLLRAAESGDTRTPAVELHAALVGGEPYAMNAVAHVGAGAEVQFGRYVCDCMTPVVIGRSPMEPPEHATVAVGVLWLRQVCGDSDARLAVTLGHEIGHIALGHTPQRRAGADGALLAWVSEQRELEADRYGLRLAVAAGYTDALGQFTAMWKEIAEHSPASSLEPASLGGSHPTALQRIEAVQEDPAARELWRASLAFACGADALRAGDWPTAQGCFEALRRDYPDSAEVLSNLACAKMLEAYCGMPDDQRAKLRGEVSAEAFVIADIARFQEGRLRGWRGLLSDAQALFGAALELDGDLAEARVGRATATAMTPDASPSELALAEAELAGIAAERAEVPAARDAIANLALLRLRLGNASSPECFLQAESDVRDAGVGMPLALALNGGLALAGSRDAARLEHAAGLLGDWLGRTSATGPRREKVRETRDAALRRLGRTVEPDPGVGTLQRTCSVVLRDGSVLHVGQSAKDARDVLEAHGVTSTAHLPSGGADAGSVPRGPVVLECPAIGAQVRLVNDAVRMVLVYAPGASVRLSSGWADPEAHALSVGDIMDDTSVLGRPIELLPLSRVCPDSELDYYSWCPRTGVAVLLGGERRIDAIAIVAARYGR